MANRLTVRDRRAGPPPKQEEPIPDDQPSGSRPARRPSHHPAEFRLSPDRLAADPDLDGPVDEPGPAAQERGLHREDREGLRRAGRPFDRERRFRTTAADGVRARGPGTGRRAARSHDDELVGGRPVRRCRSGDRSAEAHPLRPVDRDLHGVRGPRCPSRGIRGVSRGRRNRRHLAGGASRWRRIALGWRELSGRERSRSAGCPLPASCSAIGRVWKPFRRSSRSS